jgi:hypothetical protein
VVAGVQWLLVKPWTSSIQQACGIVPAQCHSHQNGQQSGFMFLSLFCLLMPWPLLGQ